MTEPKAAYAAGEQPAAAKPCPFCGHEVYPLSGRYWCHNLLCAANMPPLDIDRWNARYLDKPMPCGHAARYAVQADEGTAFCALCELDGAREQARRSSLCRAATMTPDEHAAYREAVKTASRPTCEEDGER